MAPRSSHVSGELTVFVALLGLETVDRFPVLGAVTGILLTLLMDGTRERFVVIVVVVEEIRFVCRS